MPKTYSIWTATLTLSGCLLAFSATAAGQQSSLDDDEFQQFQQQQQAEFERFEQQHWQEFEQFVAQWQAAEKAYADKLSQTWQQPQLTDRTRYVSYSDDIQEKTVVDYEANTVTVEVQGQVSRPELVRRMQQQLSTLQQTSVARAVGSDPVIRQLPKALQQRLQVSSSTPLLETDNDRSVDTSTAEITSEPAQNTTKITIKLPDKTQQARVQRILPSVNVYAQKHGLSVPLVLAIIHTESSFNPMARSHIPAFGLMQIVPTSAGKDISDFLYGEQQVFSPVYLFDPDNNIEAGSVYYYLLNRRYFKDVSDDNVRELLSIAAYNTGPGNVARTFGRDYSLADASTAANRMNQQQVYQHLMTHLPAQETKNYLKKIIKRRSYYQQLVDTL